MLQGSYAYLLIFQILVITGLVLSLIWLIVRRTREAHAEGGGPVAVSAPLAVAVAPVTDRREIDELSAKLAQSEEENTKLKAASGDAKGLKEKVKYLESKLMEYEILQEEIGTLSQLKLENQNLKQELFQVTHEVPHEQPAPPQAAAPSPEPASAMQVAPTPPPPPPPEAILFETPPGPKRDPLAAAQAEAATSGLESLLAQIDDIAGPSDKI